MTNTIKILHTTGQVVELGGQSAEQWKEEHPHAEAVYHRAVGLYHTTVGPIQTFLSQLSANRS